MLRKNVVATSIQTMVEALLLAFVAVSNVLQKYEDGEVTVRFIAAKAKVAPTKAALVPRLEPITPVLGLRLEGRCQSC